MNHINDLCFYVAPDGDDSWTGRIAQKDGNGCDGPFATFEKAIKAIRENITSGQGKIVVRGGSYYNVSMKLKGIDSGLTIEAMPGETPILYGGCRITGWKKEESGDFWYAELPKTAGNEWNFRLLTAGGRLCRRSRLPETGTFLHRTIFDVEWTSTSSGGWARKPTADELSTVIYNEEDLGPWLDINNAELTVYHKWDESLAGIAAHDSEKHELKLSNPCGHPPGSFNYYKYVVWNTREGMTAQGQWYHDRSAGRLVYWPVPGEDLQKLDMIVPTVDTIINFKEKVSNVTIEGLHLSVTATPLLAAEFAAVRMPGAIHAFDGMENCRFDRLVIKNTGGHGIKLLGCCKSVSIENCEISHTGAGGILFQNNMKEVNKNGIEIMVSCIPPEQIDDQSDCSIFNNTVEHIRMIHSSAIAIAAHCCNIIHNEISDVPYSGICYGPFNGIISGGRNARIEQNLVMRAMQVLNDGAAIYATFTMDGTISGNVVKDIQQGSEADSGRNAIYLDENAGGWVVENNLVINCSHPTLNHMAYNNAIRNNIFISDTFLKVNIIRCKDFMVEHNIMYSKGKLIFAGNPDAITNFSSNLLYSKIGEYEEYHIDDRYQHYETTALRVNDGSLIADPMFADADSGDYNTKSGSPALGLGIEKVDTSKVGRLSK